MPTSNHVSFVDRRAEAFDSVAELYDSARPPYPKDLVSDLIAHAHLDRGSRVLEVGAGTGQLTVPLAERGIPLMVIERGSQLARVLRRNVAPFPQVAVITADFDDWEAPIADFDAIVAATAFHWFDPTSRVRKCARLLRRGGTLAIIATYWGAGAHDDRFKRESQACYQRWDPEHDPSFKPIGPDDLPRRNEELERSGLFSEISLRRYASEREYTAEAYGDLLGTFSNVLAFEERRREGFLRCVRELIDTRFGGTIVRVDVHDLWLARLKET